MSLFFKAFSDLNTVKIPFEENVVKVPSNEKFWNIFGISTEEFEYTARFFK